MRTSRSKVLFFSFLLVVMFYENVFSQKEKADSLVRELSLKTDTARIQLLIQLSSACLEFSRSKAMDAVIEARTIAFQSGNEKWEARSLEQLAFVQKRNGNFDDAINTIQEAGKIFNDIGDNANYIVCLNDVSLYSFDKGDFNGALTSSFDAYKAAESVSNKIGMAYALMNSGQVYRSLQNYDKAVLDFQKALELFQDAGNKKKVADALNNLGNVYGDKSEYDKSIEYFLKAVSIAKAENDKYDLAVYLNNLGATYNDWGMEIDTGKTESPSKLKAKEYYAKALDYLSQSYDTRKNIGDKKGMVSCLTNIGNVWYQEGDNDQAISYYKKAFDQASQIGLGETELSILYNISEAYHTKDQNDSAFIYARKYSDLNDTVFHQNLADKISEMQAKYGVEKAESDARATQEEEKIITIAGSIGGVLLLVIVFVLWNRAVTRKRTNVKLNQQKSEIEEAKKEIELKNKDITDSIQYARRIQEAILPEVEFNATFGDSGFILYRPKDIVSGDLYWMAQTGDYLLFAAVDCTGHGVPGAFVSIVCSNLLSQAVKEHGLVQPSQILNDVNIRLSETLRQRQDTSRVRDGMDIALCSLNRKTLHLTYAGAFNPAWIFSKNEFIELAPDKFPVGLFEEEELRKFSFKEIQLSRGDRIYIFSDGYSDQFGGPLGKKYKRSVFCDFVKNMQHESINTQGKLLENEHLQWKGDNEQIDDILVIGIQV